MESRKRKTPTPATGTLTVTRPNPRQAPDPPATLADPGAIRLAERSPSPGGKRDAPTLSESILDTEFANSTAVIALVLGAAWAGNILLDSWEDRSFPVRFALLNMLVKGLFHSITINAIGGVFCSFAWLLPRVRPTIGFGLTYLIYAICQLAMLVLPPIVLMAVKPDYSPLLGVAVMMHHCVFIMKAHSYFFACVGTPEAQCSAGLWALFVVYPVLVYREKCDFPRTPAVRASQVIKYFLLAGLSFLMLYVLIDQEIVPYLKDFARYGFVRLWIKLLVPCFCGFLVAFYGTFHCFLNLISELFMYGSREFYKDWWHSSDFGDWTRKWNTTVQNWILAQYILLRRTTGMPRNAATFLSLIISALWHDYVMWVTWGQLSFWTCGFMSLLMVLIIFARTRFGAWLHERYGPVLVLIGLPWGFALLIETIGLAVLYCDGAVCMPHDLAHSLAKLRPGVLF